MSCPRNGILMSFVVSLVFAVGACSDDAAGPTDTTPPQVTAVTPVDELHVDVAFSEEVTMSSAEEGDHYLITESATPAPTAPPSLATAPGDTVRITAAVLQPDKKTVTIGTEASMGGLALRLSVAGVADASGNAVHPTSNQTFTGSSDPDVTPPTLLSVSPAPGSVNVGLMTSVTIRFSEAVYADLDYYSPIGAADFFVHQDGATYTLTPYHPLDYNTVYTFQVVNAEDYAFNTMSSGPWRFTTIASTDTRRPTIVSTTPHDLATNVDVNSNIVIVFSEPVNQGFFSWQITGFTDIFGAAVTWSSDGKKVTLNPSGPIPPDQQFVLTIDPSVVLDLAGNHIKGLQIVRFTTGSALENGSIHGTLVGDPGSEAADPKGATVVAHSGSIFKVSFGYETLGSTIATANGAYAISYLGDGKYFPLTLLDTTGDGQFDPRSGDAIGAYGIDLVTRDLEPDSVMISAGSDVSGINFPLYDPSAITGTVTYEGAHEAGFAYAYAGLFDPAGFTPADPGEPVAKGPNYSTSWPDRPNWNVNSFVQSIPDGDYYVGVYLDLDENRIYDPATEPVGFYGGIDSPTAVHVANGNEVSGLVIELIDPTPVSHSSISVAWGPPPQSVIPSRSHRRSSAESRSSQSVQSK